MFTNVRVFLNDEHSFHQMDHLSIGWKKKIQNLHNERDNAHGCMPKSSNDTFEMVQSGKLHFTSGHFKCNAVGFLNLMWNRPINSHYRVFWWFEICRVRAVV